MTGDGGLPRAIAWARAAERAPAGDLHSWFDQGPPAFIAEGGSFRHPVRAHAWDSPTYPQPLRHLHRPPAAIFVRGGEDLPDRASMVAIIGSRNCTDDGRAHAFDLARALARAGAVVVSGLALGIDAAAHEGALAGGGRTLAILASPVDDPTPPRNHGLAERIVAAGSWLASERPPGAAVRPPEFPRRNRLVAAWSRLVIVVEAGLPSGTLGTVEAALALGTDVGAVPGPIHSPASAGVNRLLAAGAHVIASVDDALALLGRAGPPRIADQDPEAAALLAGIPGGSAPRDRWIEASSLPADRARLALLRLLGRGDLRVLPGGRIGRVL